MKCSPRLIGVGVGIGIGVERFREARFDPDSDPDKKRAGRIRDRDDPRDFKKIQNSKSQYRNSKQIRMTKIQMIKTTSASTPVLNFCHFHFWSLFRISDLEFRILSFIFGYCFETGDPHAVWGVRRTISDFEVRIYVLSTPIPIATPTPMKSPPPGACQGGCRMR